MRLLREKKDVNLRSLRFTLRRLVMPFLGGGVVIYVVQNLPVSEEPEVFLGVWYWCFGHFWGNYCCVVSYRGIFGFVKIREVFGEVYK